MDTNSIIVELSESLKTQVKVNMAVMDCLIEIINSFPASESREPMVASLKELLSKISEQREAAFSVLHAATKALTDEQ